MIAPSDMANKITVTQVSNSKWDIEETMYINKSLKAPSFAAADSVYEVMTDEEVNVVPNWIQNLEIEASKSHWLFVDKKTCAVYIQLENYDCVPAKFRKYVAVIYPKPTSDWTTMKVYIAKTEKGRDMWSNMLVKYPTAKKVGTININVDCDLTANIDDYSTRNTKQWYDTISNAVRARLKDFCMNPNVALPRLRHG